MAGCFLTSVSSTLLCQSDFSVTRSWSLHMRMLPHRLSLNQAENLGLREYKWLGGNCKYYHVLDIWIADLASHSPPQGGILARETLWLTCRGDTT